MTKDQATKCVSRLAKLFMGQVNDAHVVLLVKGFLPLSIAAVEGAIDEHRTSPDLVNGFWNMGNLLEECRAAERGPHVQKTGQFIPDQSFAAVYRKQRPDLRDANDYEVIIRVHRGFLRDCLRDAPPDETFQASGPFRIYIGRRSASYGYFRKFENSCREALISAGMDVKENPGVAEIWTRYLFLEEARDCAQWLEQVRDLVTPAQAKANADRVPVYA